MQERRHDLINPGELLTCQIKATSCGQGALTGGIIGFDCSINSLRKKAINRIFKAGAAVTYFCLLPPGASVGRLLVVRTSITALYRLTAAAMFSRAAFSGTQVILFTVPVILTENTLLFLDGTISLNLATYGRTVFSEFSGNLADGLMMVQTFSIAIRSSNVR